MNESEDRTSVIRPRSGFPGEDSVRGPVYLLVSLWLKPEQEVIFTEYERAVLQILPRYGGVLERRLAIKETTDAPDEVHLLRFPSRDAYEQFGQDPERLALSAVRAQAVERTEILLGVESPRT